MESFIAGCLGGGVGLFVTHPLDTVKIRLQAQHGSGSTLRYKGIMDCLIQMFKQEGVYGYYKGVTSPIIGVSIQNAFLFGIQRFTRTYLDQSITGEFFAGSIAGALQTVLSCPIEMSKIRLQMQDIGTRSTKEMRKYKGPIDIFVKMYSEEGIRGPGRGYFVTLIRDSPGCGFFFASYAWMCQILTPKDTSVSNLSIPRLLLAGGLCGAASWVVIYPFDIIKTRVQAEGFQPVGKYRNYAHCVQECLEEGGLRTFTRGLNTTVIRAIPLNAVTFCTVSVVERHFKRLHKTMSE